jgi:4-carboxymuconolactone decarboxylase
VGYDLEHDGSGLMPDDDARAEANAMWQEIMGFDPPPITDPYTEFTTDAVFGRVWTRPGLPRRDRRITSLTVIALRGLKEPLVAHMSAAIDSGDISVDELHEWVLHLAHYGGWPIAANAYAVLREVQAHPSRS